jgi:hypothetical protein
MGGGSYAVLEWNHYNIFFARPVHDWEVEMVCVFFFFFDEVLYSQRVRLLRC